MHTCGYLAAIAATVYGAGENTECPRLVVLVSRAGSQSALLTDAKPALDCRADRHLYCHNEVRCRTVGAESAGGSQMSAAAFNLRDDAGEVLCGVMWDPATSEDALSSSQATSNVLWALLPNARRKAAFLRAAGSFWLTAELRSVTPEA